MRVELHYLGLVIDLGHVHTKYKKKFYKYSGRPVLYHLGGKLHFEFPYGAPGYGRLVERMFTKDDDLYPLGYPVDKGKIVFYNPDGTILKDWDFEDGAIVYYKVVFDPNGSGLMVEMVISAAIQDYGYRLVKPWHVSPIAEEGHKSPVHAVEQQKNPEIVKGYWTSDKEGKAPLQESKLGETVYFQIERLF